MFPENFMWGVTYKNPIKFEKSNQNEKYICVNSSTLLSIGNRK